MYGKIGGRAGEGGGRGCTVRSGGRAGEGQEEALGAKLRLLFPPRRTRGGPGPRGPGPPPPARLTPDRSREAEANA